VRNANAVLQEHYAKTAASGALLKLRLDYEYETEKLAIRRQVLWEGHAFVPVIYCHSRVLSLKRQTQVNHVQRSACSAYEH